MFPDYDYCCRVKDTAFMWMTNGNNSPDNDGTMTDEEILIFAEVAVATHMVVALLFEICLAFLILMPATSRLQSLSLIVKPCPVW